MNHPAREELTRYAFDETTDEPRERLEAHLSECPDCARHLAGLRETLHRMDQWQIPPRDYRRRQLDWRPLKWAAAAAILFCLGLVWGRTMAPAAPDAAALRAEITADLERTVTVEFQNQLRAAIDTEWKAALAAAREENRRFAIHLIENLRRDHASDYLSLRNDLETLATLTEDEMLNARHSILQVAAFATTADGEPLSR